MESYLNHFLKIWNFLNSSFTIRVPYVWILIALLIIAIVKYRRKESESDRYDRLRRVHQYLLDLSQEVYQTDLSKVAVSLNVSDHIYTIETSMGKIYFKVVKRRDGTYNLQFSNVYQDLLADKCKLSLFVSDESYKPIDFSDFSRTYYDGNLHSDYVFQTLTFEHKIFKAILEGCGVEV